MDPDKNINHIPENKDCAKKTLFFSLATIFMFFNIGKEQLQINTKGPLIKTYDSYSLP